MTPTSTSLHWENWAGSVTAAPRAMPAPTSLEAIQELVREVGDRRGTLRVVGAGHSFTPLVATNDTIMTLDGFSGIESVDAATAQAVVKATLALPWNAPQSSRIRAEPARIASGRASTKFCEKVIRSIRRRLCASWRPAGRPTTGSG